MSKFVFDLKKVEELEISSDEFYLCHVDIKNDENTQKFLQNLSIFTKIVSPEFVKSLDFVGCGLEKDACFVETMTPLRNL